jgi:hypothetical protein
LLRIRGAYKRFEKLRASNDLTQMVTTNPDFFKGLDKIRIDKIR